MERFPAGPFAPVLFLAQVPAVIGPEHDHGIVRVRTVIQRIQQTADVMVDKADAGQIRRDGRFPLLVFEHRGMCAGSNRLYRPAFSGCAQVGQIVPLDWWKRGCFLWIKIKVSPWSPQRNVRPVKTDPEEETVCRSLF